MTKQAGALGTLAARVRTGQTTASELVDSSLRRIDQSRELNAVVRTRAADARREAEAVDEAVTQGGQVGPLAGLPVLVKDIEDVAGLPTTCGSIVNRDSPPAVRDSLTVRRLRAAGAIVVGKTNLSEFAFKAHSSNRLFGSTRNPWAADFSPGGSSGGSAAALIAGLAPICTASDGGGSIRIPASACGLVGLKPTNGIIARDPIPPWPDLSTDGPIATTVADIALLLEIMAGPSDGDPGAQTSWSMIRNELPRRALAVPRIVPGTRLPEESQRLFDTAVEAVDKLLGVPVESFENRRLFPAGNIDEDWFCIAGAEQAYHLGRDFIEAHAHLMESAFVGYMQEALRITLPDYLAARRRRYEYTRELDELLGSDTIMLTPTVTVSGWSPEGWMPGADGPGLPLDAFNTQAQNVTGHPAISLPAGHFDNGIPFGLQVTGPRYLDGMLLAFAALWEAERPWPTIAQGFIPFGQ